MRTNKTWNIVSTSSPLYLSSRAFNYFILLAVRTIYLIRIFSPGSRNVCNVCNFCNFALLPFALCNNNLYSHLYLFANKSIVQNSWHSLELWGVQPKYNVINANKIIDWVFPFLWTFCWFLGCLNSFWSESCGYLENSEIWLKDEDFVAVIAEFFWLYETQIVASH